MQASELITQRMVNRVDQRRHLGGDSQVDDRNVVIAPLATERTDPFLLLSEDWFSTTGYEWHPHRGLETVTLVLDGVLEHGDNLGNDGALTSGDVQWMTAGRGIIHRELAFRNERAHVLQLWLNLPGEMKMVDTRYQDLPALERPTVDRGGTRIDLISGTVDATSGPALTHWPISGALITLEPNQSYEHRLPGRDRAFFYVLAGEVTVAGRPVKTGEIAWSDPVQSGLSVVTLNSSEEDQPSVVMAYSGQPIGEPVAMGGPFVMNDQTEIQQAFRDFHSGKFGPIPRRGRLP